MVEQMPACTKGCYAAGTVSVCVSVPVRTCVYARARAFASVGMRALVRAVCLYAAAQQFFTSLCRSTLTYPGLKYLLAVYS